ncbi:MAG: hypothetical protein LBL74_07820 [Bacteroidales bacterium]|jgi:hypothetical protein|nr:hypothetical protein [Bacteroidales bacterium]
MKQILFSVLCIGLLTSILTSCSDEDVYLHNGSKGFNKDFTINQSETGLDNIDTSLINADALKYYSLIKDVILLTRANELKIAENPNNTKIPLIEKLKDMILFDSNDNKMSFYDLDSNEQIEFLNEWVIIQAYDLTEKIEKGEAIGLYDYLKEHNSIVTNVLKYFNANEDNPIDNIQEFFTSLENHLYEAPLNNTDSLPHNYKWGDGEDVNGDVDNSRLKYLLKRYGRRGDFLVTLPHNNHPWLYINFSNERYKVGHAAIITQPVTDTATSINDTLTVETWTGNGVCKKRIQNWNKVPSYLMGIQKVEWKWRWRGFRSWWYKVKTPVSNPNKLANRAEQYLGHQYVYWYEFVTAKWAAPARFTCTTLVWWSSKKEYDINISDWYAPLVSPTGLYLDESTYCRVHIKN